jgi:2-methylcitrate dehydratase PrpD
MGEGGESLRGAGGLIPGMGVTRQLAGYVVDSHVVDVPQPVVHEAKRSLVNYLGCALGGSSHPAVDIAISALQPFSGPQVAGVFGRTERLDPFHAALVNGMSGHVLDFDDTHLRTLMHPTVPVASALLALAERQPISGEAFVHAFVLGVEVECRIANAIYLAHNVNWYITGTAGVFGAAAAAGRVLGLDKQSMTAAFGIAATQAAGLREMAGTMCKSFVHGRAAQNGMTSAFLAASGFTSSERAIEAPRGFANVLASDADLVAITKGLGTTYELLLNTYKPYACGVVCHPAIDGCIRLRNDVGLDPDSIESVALRVHPLALKLTGIRDPRTGLESKWSIFHSAAVAIVDGAAGEHQYTDARVSNPVVVRLRGRVTASADPGLREDAAHILITLLDGRIVEHHVEHAIGSSDCPMTDRDLESKFLMLSDGVLSRAQAQTLLGACWEVQSLGDVGHLCRLAVRQ